jgi:TonB family protein
MPHEPNKRLKQSIMSVLVVLACGLGIGAQQSGSAASNDRDRGIRLYNQRDTKGAISALRAAVKNDKEDGFAWYYLGMALVREDDLKNARKAFDAAVKLKPDFGFAHTGLAFALMAAGKDEEAGREASTAIKLSAADTEAHYILGVVHLRLWRNTEARSEADIAIAQDPKFAPAYLLKCQTVLALEGEASARSAKVIHVPTDGPLSESEIAERRRRARKTAESYAIAAEALEMYLKLAASDRETAVWQGQLATLRAFAGAAQAAERRVFAGWEVTTKVKILQKTEPIYTERARMAGIAGTVILRAVFSSTGVVEHILVVRSLPDGLTEQSIQAASRIRFTPASRDGKPVSMIMELQYNFNFY